MTTCLKTPQSRCRAAIASCDITPPAGIYHRMWGAATHDRATGIHRRRLATVLVSQALHGEPDAATEQVAMAVDLCLVWAAERPTLLEQVCRENGRPAAQLLVAFP